MAPSKGNSSKAKKQETKCPSTIFNSIAAAKAKSTSLISVGAQIKRVIDLLQETRQVLTLDEIIERCKIEKSVLEILKKNPKLYFDGSCFSYKAKHNLKDDYELLNFIQKFAEGINVSDLKDSYPDVLKDLQALKDANKIWLLKTTGKQEIAFPNDPRINIIVDEDLKNLFKEIELPVDMLEIQEDLLKNGMKPVTDTKKRRFMAPAYKLMSDSKHKRKRGEITNRTKLTNSYLPELFFKK